MSESAYAFLRQKDLPAHLTHACRRQDVEACLESLGLAAPFHKLGIYRGPSLDVPHAFRRPGVIPPVLRVARAAVRYHPNPSWMDDHRRHTRRLEVYAVPTAILREVRAALREDGLPMLVRWLERQRRLPETALVRNLALHLEYHVKDRRLETRKGETRAGSLRSP